MGLAALKMEFDEFVSAAPAPPSVEIIRGEVIGASASSPSAFEESGRRLLESNEELNLAMNDWQTKTERVVAGFEKIIADTVASTDDDREKMLRFVIDSMAPMALKGIDEALGMLQSAGPIDETRSEALDLLARRNPRAKRIIREFRRRRDVVLTKHLREALALRDRVMLSIWRHDPDARASAEGISLRTAQDVDGYFATLMSSD